MATPNCQLPTPLIPVPPNLTLFSTQAGQTPPFTPLLLFQAGSGLSRLVPTGGGSPAHITRPRRLPPMAPFTPSPLPFPLPQPPPHFLLLFPSFPTSPFLPSLSPLPLLTDPPRHSTEVERGSQRSAAHFRQKPQCFREAQGKGKAGHVRALR